MRLPRHWSFDVLDEPMGSALAGRARDLLAEELDPGRAVILGRVLEELRTADPLLGRYDDPVRTTLTLDDDLARDINIAAARTGRTFKAVVNDALRAGLSGVTQARKPRRYRLKPASLGGPAPGFDLDRALALADALADEAVARKLEQRR